MERHIKTEQYTQIVRDKILSRSSQDKVTAKDFYPLPSATLREIVHSLRLSGCPIASDCNGYWKMENEADRTVTIQHLRSRYRKIIEVKESIENINLHNV